MIETEEPLQWSKKPDRSFQYCWEFNAKSREINEECQNCIVYRSRALRCYEMIQLPIETGHSKVFCQTSCEECDYYKLVLEQSINVLVVTRPA